MSAVNPFAANFAKEAFEKFRDTPSTESCDKKIADEWGELMREYFEKVPDKYSETIHFAEPSPPLRSTGSKSIWAGDSQKVEGNQGVLLTFPFNENMREFVQSESKRAIAAQRKFDNLPNKSPGVDEYQLTAMLITFAIKTAVSWDTTNQIGGDVDSLELSSDGKMRWIHVKPACKGQIIQ